MTDCGDGRTSKGKNASGEMTDGFDRVDGCQIHVRKRTWQGKK